MEQYIIDSVEFSFLKDETVKNSTIPYLDVMKSEKKLSHHDGNIVLPYSCYPSTSVGGKNLKDNLETLYTKLSKENDCEKKQTILNEIQLEIQQRWKSSGKSGRWRQDICGKRCNFSGRSVLSPNPKIKLYEVVLPYIWRNNMTLIETYIPDMEVVSVFDESGKEFSSKFRKPEFGMKVKRLLNEGELVLVNRQPTLRETNFVAMEIKWGYQKTIQLHPGVLSMFDADCDGDEINIHLPQVSQSYLLDLHICKSIWQYGTESIAPSVIQDATVGLCIQKDLEFHNKKEIHDTISESMNKNSNDINHLKDVLVHIQDLYDTGCNNAFYEGFSVGFDFLEVDYMISCGAKGKNAHKEKIRNMLDGIYDNDTHFAHCQESRIAMISTSLKTADTGYISRRLSYHLDDVKIYSTQKDGYLIKDYDEWLLQYPTYIPDNIKHIRNIGLYFVSVIMPPLTQQMLDSFHTASAGETIEDKTHLFSSLINCTSKDLHQIYNTKGILFTKLWLFTKLNIFFEYKIQTFWLKLLVNFLCVTGKPIGIDMTSLTKRFQIYSNIQNKYFNSENYKVQPVFKFCKFGYVLKNLKKAAELNLIDDLSSNHSKEIFF